MLDTIMTIIFWISFFMVFWAYFGYLAFLKLLSLFYRRKVHKEANFYPDISIVITAYNEEKRIAEKLKNTLDLDYPKENREIIVVTDGCTDRTVEIVKSYADQGIKLLEIHDRHGKHYGQGKGIHKAEHDIVILTDATTFLPGDAAEKIISNFADQGIGCVSSEDRMKSTTAESSGEGIYVKYEMLLRRLESKVGSLVGVSGCFFAVRKKLCWEWIDNMSADFYMPSVTRL
jgi:cellulose synthase/poly-beta-1,6-N-acetylglucosamine synthase-like glycosyltransferase